VTVLLDGQGGDELLGGYHSFVGYRIADLVRRGRVDRAAAELRAYAGRQGGAWQRALRLAVVPFVPGALRSRARLRDKSAAAALRSSTRALAAEPRTVAPPGLDALGRERYRIYRQGLPALLRYEDRNSMAFSIEARLPFLDYRLVELSFRLDPSLLIRDGSPKWLLRHALADRMPEAVRTRQDKIGFQTPQARWLRESVADIDAQVARPGFGGGYLDANAVRLLVDRQRHGNGDDFAVWRCLCLDLWLQELVES
jgi:asparagine synthase (glutamine-hydrolysing)